MVGVQSASRRFRSWAAICWATCRGPGSLSWPTRAVLQIRASPLTSWWSWPFCEMPCMHHKGFGADGALDKRDLCVALSSTEGEFICYVDALTMGEPLQVILNILEHNALIEDGQFKIRGDNLSGIQLLLAPGGPWRTAPGSHHLRLRSFVLRERFAPRDGTWRMFLVQSWPDDETRGVAGQPGIVSQDPRLSQMRNAGLRRQPSYENFRICEFAGSDGLDVLSRRAGICRLGRNRKRWIKTSTRTHKEVKGKWTGPN